MTEEKALMVVEGEYSDYRVLAVFTGEDAQAKAEQYLSHCHGAGYEWGGARTEDVPLNHVLDAPLGCKQWEITLYHPPRFDNTVSAYSVQPNRRPSRIAVSRDGRVLRFACWARDKQHALKIASERRAMLIATGEWVPGEDKWIPGPRQEAKQALDDGTSRANFDSIKDSKESDD